MCGIVCAQAEIKEFVEKVYGLPVDKVNTCNYLGRKKHGKAGFYRWGPGRRLGCSCSGQNDILPF